mgnify:CR=1 FL=1
MADLDFINFNAEQLNREELEKLIEHHNRQYWEPGEPEIPDVRYDELLRALRRIDPGNALLTRVYAPRVAGSESSGTLTVSSNGISPPIACSPPDSRRYSTRNTSFPRISTFSP